MQNVRIESRESGRWDVVCLCEIYSYACGD